MEADRSKGNARPKKILDDSIKKRLIAAISVGCTYDLACKSSGLAKSTFYSWHDLYKKISHLSEDKAKKHQDWLYWDLFKDIEEAEGKAAEKWLTCIEMASEVQWQAAAWKLERRYKDEYGKATIEMKINSNQEDLDQVKEEINKLKITNPIL